MQYRRLTARNAVAVTSLSLTAAILVAGCSAVGAGATGTIAASMMDHSPMPSAEASMMDHSPMPSAEASMMDHSPMPSAAAPVSTGTFHAVDGSATGTVALYHNADGTFTITFENFSIGAIAHTDVVMVSNKDVTTDADIDRSAIIDLGPLKAASGMQDFKVPAGGDAMSLHTVVLWDTAMTHAVAAAPLH